MEPNEPSGIMNGVIIHTPAQLEGWERVFAQNPRHAKMRDLIVSYARERGGLTLEYWRLLVGPFFGEPQKMNTQQVAERLGVSVSELSDIADETWKWVRPRLDAHDD